MAEQLNYSVGVNQPAQWLLENCLISGMYTSERRGYKPPAAILPTEPRPLTEQEAEHFAARQETRFKIWVGHIPLSEAVQPYTPLPYSKKKRLHLPPYDDVDFTLGLRDQIVWERVAGAEAAYAPPNQLTVSIDNSSIDPETGEGLSTALHIDKLLDVDATIINLGDDKRWHLVAPDYNRFRIGGRTPEIRAAYVENHVNRNQASVLWLPVDPPGMYGKDQPHVGAVRDSPVGLCLHDGSTYGQSGSTALYRFYAHGMGLPMPIQSGSIGGYRSINDSPELIGYREKYTMYPVIAS
jgi:hypothetical protein